MPRFLAKRSEGKCSVHHWYSSALWSQTLFCDGSGHVRSECNALCEVFQLLHRACFSICDSMALFICWSQFSIQSFSFHKPSGRLTHCLSPDGLTRQSLTSVASYLVINCECFSTVLLLKKNSSACGTENHPIVGHFVSQGPKPVRFSSCAELARQFNWVRPAASYLPPPSLLTASFPVFYLVSILLIHALTLESILPPTLFLTCKPLEWDLKQQNKARERWMETCAFLNLDCRQLPPFHTESSEVVVYEDAWEALSSSLGLEKLADNCRRTRTWKSFSTAQKMHLNIFNILSLPSMFEALWILLDIKHSSMNLESCQFWLVLFLFCLTRLSFRVLSLID